MKKLISLLLSLALCAAMSGCTTQNGDAKNQSDATVALEYIAKDGTILAAEDLDEAHVQLTGDFSPEAGSIVRVTVTGTNYVSLDCFGLGKAILYVPDGTYEFTVPEETPRRDYPAGTFGAGFTLSAEIPSASELSEERNIALNPYDLTNSTGYPHAVANNVYNNAADPDFWARNAIDGFSTNTGHGAYPYQSWGPDRISGLEFTVELGRECRIDSVTLYVRADFPHDISWSSCDILDDGGNIVASAALEQTAEGQVITFSEPIISSSLKFVNMVSPDNSKWSGFTEIVVTGKDIG